MSANRRRSQLIGSRRDYVIRLCAMSAKSEVAKGEFQRMIELNHVRPSKRAYASPLYIVPKRVLSRGDLLVIIVHLLHKQSKKYILYLVSRISLQNHMVNKSLAILTLSELTIKFQ
ncbi:hypothetical protein NPIL_649391 [Nephila pilipes]|uniref:Uncharacterized protein n=1 Tax=Nephila pilipes TaxID=299642 RepID=A0A8X6MYM8_NEPPI|nr:hypothetical protein NPIL_649391 [Nephila pilipes]